MGTRRKKITLIQFIFWRSETKSEVFSHGWEDMLFVSEQKKIGQLLLFLRLLIFGDGQFLADQAALYLPHSLINSFINYIEFIPNHTNLGRLCFAKHNAAHHDERKMPHTMFRHHNFNKIS